MSGRRNVRDRAKSIAPKCSEPVEWRLLTKRAAPALDTVTRLTSLKSIDQHARCRANAAPEARRTLGIISDRWNRNTAL